MDCWNCGWTCLSDPKVGLPDGVPLRVNQDASFMGYKSITSSHLYGRNYRKSLRRNGLLVHSDPLARFWARIH
ncbi:hypothetical protein V6N13_091995 [Hibiscus sabdariffa]|uniref:Uncharacterized protein n=1 Tax=Hibiscus sabdariffa TaxID=183260 RepID=A0ABR2QFM6_9ROSI